MTQDALIRSAEIVIWANDLKTELPFFQNQLGFRLDEIYPADDPAVAVISGHGLRLRLDRSAPESSSEFVIRCDAPAAFETEFMTSPSGHLVAITPSEAPLEIPETEHAFVVRHMIDSDAWVIGRAGMHYRDLIPNRLGGSIIASHIRIPDGGPVPDMVHYHKVGFQLIFCLHGWVRLVYEDQGEPFILKAGNCVIQPPEIRHRVLEASDNVEVLEIGVPADHITSIDHEMTLPNGPPNPDRTWQGTRFVHHKAAATSWDRSRLPAWEMQDTGIGAATQGVAGVKTYRPIQGVPPRWWAHDGDILFTFVKSGEVTLEAHEQDTRRLVTGDAFVIPPFLKARYSDPTPDCELIEVALEADFETFLGTLSAR